MPRQSYTSILTHTDDATFRVWGSQLSAAIAACLTVTTDTGQVNWTTATRPGVGTYPNYEVYRFSDALHATAPLFIRVNYGTGGTATFPAIQVSVGTGTNGAGTLTGLLPAIAQSRSAAPSVNNQTTRVCYKDGCFTLAWGLQTGGTAPALLFGIDRSRTAAGVSTGAGAQIVQSSSSATTGASNQMTFLTTPPAQVTTETARYKCLTGAEINSAVSSITNQALVFNHFQFVPEPAFVLGWLTYRNAEITAFTEIDVALLGATSHHYVCYGNLVISTFGATGQSADVPAFLWEV